MDTVLKLILTNLLILHIVISIIGLTRSIYLKKLKTTIPVTAKIVTAYSKYLCSQKNVTLDLSKARYVTVEVNSKCYTIRIREKLSKNQKEILVYTDGNYAIMYSEKKRFINQEDIVASFTLSKSQKIFALLSIVLILLVCGELCYNKYSKDLEILQSVYDQKVETYKEMVMSNNLPDENTVLLLMFPEMFSFDYKSVISCLWNIHNMDALLANNTDALADNRVKLSHPVWNAVLNNHYSQLDSGTWNNRSACEKNFWIGIGYYFLLFILTILSILYLIAVCVTIIYRKILMRRITHSLESKQRSRNNR